MGNLIFEDIVSGRKIIEIIKKNNIITNHL